MSVYIITRSRPDNIKKIVPRWLDQNLPVTLVVEEEEHDHHTSLVRGMGWDNVEVISPKSVNKGVGHARAFAVWDADRHGLKSMIMSDDDLRPTSVSYMHLLLREAERPGVLGVGATRPLHDKFSGGITSDRDDVILCPGGWGMQLFALNVQQTLDIGSFDSKLDCWGEDHELMRNGIAAGIPWLVHCGVRSEAIGVRYDPGGLNAYTGGNEGRTDMEMKCRQIIFNRWPRYVSPPNKKPRMQWASMMDDYITGWRDQSAIHGGQWVGRG